MKVKQFKSKQAVKNNNLTYTSVYLHFCSATSHFYTETNYQYIVTKNTF